MRTCNLRTPRERIRLSSIICTLALILGNVRTAREREGGMTARIAACRIGERRLREIVAKYGRREVARYGRHLLDYSAAMMCATLRRMPKGTYPGEDYLDDDGITPEPLRIVATVRIRGERAEVPRAFQVQPICARGCGGAGTGAGRRRLGKG